jgi:surface protein
MSDLFYNSKFNGEISRWNVSNVTNMNLLFKNSKFNGDISKWDVSKVDSMINMFYKSNFTGDLVNWEPYNLEGISHIYNECKAPVPYWAKFWCREERNKNIITYHMDKKLGAKNGLVEKRIKI